LAARVALRTRAVVLVRVEGRIVERAEDLAGAGQDRALDVALGIPEIRADERFRALRIRLVDRDDDPELRDGSFDLARREQLPVVGDDTATVDAKRVAYPGDQEDQADGWVDEQIRERVRDPVPRPLRNQQLALSEDA